MAMRPCLLVALVCCGLVAGCSSGGGGAKGVKVTGKVTLNGTPVSGAKVAFCESSATNITGGPSAVTDDTGEYAVVGVQPGAYKVVVYKLIAKKGMPLPDENDLAQIEASGAGDHALPKKYSTVATTTLTAQVDSGSNQVDLKLTGK